jgi:AcrR family transcriptional regulator
MYEAHGARTVHSKYTPRHSADKLRGGKLDMQNARAKPVSELFGTPATPKTGRGRLVAAAIELFYRQGFAAVGIDQVIAAAGVTKTTFYENVEAREGLRIAAVEPCDEREVGACYRAVRKLASDEPACREQDEVIENLDFVGVRTHRLGSIHQLTLPASRSSLRQRSFTGQLEGGPHATSARTV